MREERDKGQGTSDKTCPVCGRPMPKRQSWRKRPKVCSRDCWARRKGGAWARPVPEPPLALYVPPVLKGPDRCKERACVYPAARAGGWCRHHMALFGGEAARDEGQGARDRAREVQSVTDRETKRGRVRRPTWGEQAGAVAHWGKAEPA